MQRLGNGAEVSLRRTARSPVTRRSSAAEELGTSLAGPPVEGDWS